MKRLMLAGWALWLSIALTSAGAEPPRVVLQITVDQLRGDMLARYRDRFGPGGFRRLLDEGTVFTNAHYGTGNTFTAAGHAVLVTGADTPEHGMVANDWWDRETGKTIYCTADSAHQLLGEPTKAGAGTSPLNLTSTTLGDELVGATNGRSRAFAVAGKDRSAIIPGGHRGKVFWWSEATGNFTSSTYYFTALPAWVSSWNVQKVWNRYRNEPWTPLKDPASYRFASAAANEHARPNKTLGRSFPHPMVAQSDAVYFSMFRYTPFLDDLMARFARELVTQEKLGQTTSTDYLSLSFSATDYIGHAYGPNSMEAEDNLLRLDATLAALFQFLDQGIGLDHVLIVLSADHGVDDIPEAVRAKGFNADRVYPDKLRAELNQALRARFAVATDLIAGFVPPGFYLDAKQLETLHLDREVVARALADELARKPGVAYAFTKSDLLNGRIARTSLLDKVQRSFHPTRSGDVVMVQSQFWYLYPEPEAHAAMHGSPYDYDTFVPIIFRGPGIKARAISRAVEPASIAPTIANYLAIKAPSGSATAALDEISAP